MILSVVAFILLVGFSVFLFYVLKHIPKTDGINYDGFGVMILWILSIVFVVIGFIAMVQKIREVIGKRTVSPMKTACRRIGFSSRYFFSWLFFYRR